MQLEQHIGEMMYGHCAICRLLKSIGGGNAPFNPRAQRPWIEVRTIPSAPDLVIPPLRRISAA